ncbi:MAG TPA: MFS transporter [Candidatus Limnocylindria bacterium]|nr:MFS transporter [Candidatus Limnocylindria bacterium]
MNDRWPRILVPLRHRDFRLLWTGQTVSSFGNHVQSIAMPFQLLALGASPLQLGIAVALDTLSGVVFLLVGGAVADRVARRTLIIASDLLGGCVVAVVAFLSATNQLRIEHVYVARVALGAADAFLRPAYTAIIADIVPTDVLRAGNAARLLGRSVARIAGPAVGGVAVALGGPALAFGINALTFVFSIGTLLLASPARRAVASSVSLLRDIREGFSYVFSVGWLWTTTLYFMAVNFAYAGQPGVLTPLLVRDVLAGDAETFGAIMSAYGVGSILASVVVAQLAIRRPGRVLFAFELLAGVAVLAIGLLPSSLPVVVSMAIMGMGLSSSTVIWEALLQRHVPERMLGRVASIDLLGNSLINPMAPIAAAALVGSIGPAGTFVAAAAYAMVLASIGLVASPLRRIDEGISYAERPRPSQ